ncbi:MAG: gluconeogenesis factor YvcK family protein [Peptoniphilaceae bacterium]
MSKKVVVIGGGTGVSSILKGIKKYTDQLTAIVTMADDGGGSGILRQDLGILPPGDVRNCMVALSSTETVMEKLLQFRFDSGSLKGQNFGNILIAALCGIYGSFDSALIEMENVLNITGKVIPVTLANIHLEAEFENGDKCIGESIIPNMAYKLDTKIKKMSLFPEIPKANPKAIKAIEESELIILGPGSLYTSAIPNLIVEGIVDSIKSSKSRLIYIPNIMTEKGETTDFTIRDHVNAIYEHSFKDIIDLIIINNKDISQDLKEKYSKERAEKIEVTNEDLEFLQSSGIKVIVGDFLEDRDDAVRHSGSKIAAKLQELFIL